MRTKTKHKVNAIAPRLSDEDPDPIEQDDAPDGYHLLQEGWMPWDPEDMNDVRRLIMEYMPAKQRYVLLCFLDGMSYTEAGLSEKHWRYHFAKGVEFIKKELKL
jgi:DNA-directed RNA polymerase specialized sigma24 family protein